MTVYVTDIIHDAGSVVVFGGTDLDGAPVRFGADHRSAQAIADMLNETGEVPCEIEDWQLL